MCAGPVSRRTSADCRPTGSGVAYGLAHMAEQRRGRKRARSCRQFAQVPVARVLALLQLAAALQACHEGGEGLSPDAGRRADVGRVGELLLQAAPERPGVRRLPRASESPGAIPFGRGVGLLTRGSGRTRPRTPAWKRESAPRATSSSATLRRSVRSDMPSSCEAVTSVNPEPSACSTSRARVSIRGRAASKKAARSVAVSHAASNSAYAPLTRAGSALIVYVWFRGP